MKVWEVVGNRKRFKREPTDFQQVYGDSVNYPTPIDLIDRKIIKGKPWFEAEANKETMKYIK